MRGIISVVFAQKDSLLIAIKMIMNRDTTDKSNFSLMMLFRRFICSYTGCNKSYYRGNELSRHISKSHQLTHLQCKEDP